MIMRVDLHEAKSAKHSAIKPKAQTRFRRQSGREVWALECRVKRLLYIIDEVAHIFETATKTNKRAFKRARMFAA